MKKRYEVKILGGNPESDRTVGEYHFKKNALNRKIEVRAYYPHETVVIWDIYRQGYVS